jgi:hypothetical protein
LEHIASSKSGAPPLTEIGEKTTRLKGVDGHVDGVWTTRRGREVFALSIGGKPATPTIDGNAVEIAPSTIYIKHK